MHSYTFFSNFLNHHQLPFCLEMNRRLGDGFRFVATEPIHQERFAMGYADMNKAYPFVLRSYEDTKALREALRLGNESDVVIIGSAPELFVEKRISENKLTFRYSERIFKKGRWRILSPRTIMLLFGHHMRFQNKRLYMLCASAYTAGDFAMVGAYRGKCYKWGYFPEVREFDFAVLMASKYKARLSILWAGRFLDWKHPEKALHVASYLRDNCIDFSLKIIGGGDMDRRMKSLTNLLNLEDCVEYLGFLSPDAVRKEMERSHIFLFTSDYNEGWGVVLNEAMNSGCAVVASHAIGAVPFLVKDGENGLVYKNNNLIDLCNKVLKLCVDSNYRNKLAENAYFTMTYMWNAKVAVNRLLNIANKIQENSDCKTLYNEGPCSMALPDN